MNQEEWSAGVTRVIADAMRRRRKQLGMSAQQLADACAGVGMEIPRSVLANLESGRRTTITVAELLVLARVLDIAPILLLFSLGETEKVEVLPGKQVETWRAMEWFDGSDYLALNGEGWDPHTWRQPDPVVRSFRWHRRHLENWSASVKLIAQQREDAERASMPSEREGLAYVADANERRLKQEEDKLADVRRAMRERGVTSLPEIPPALEHVDNPSDDPHV
jgi:transcriptional regulator with XRE-family HTH domain